jgi:hypothetical protein
MKCGDFVSIPVDNPILHGTRKLVTAKAGDLLLWDSRTIHCSSPATRTPETSTDDLLRAVAYICMTPERLVTDKSIIWQRKMAYELGLTTTHWP